MARTANVSALARTVHKLRAERHKLAARLSEIDGLFTALGGASGPTAQPAPVASPAVLAAPRRGRPPGRRPGRPKGSVNKVRKGPQKRGTFPETADQFVLGLLKGKNLITAQVNAAWKEAGRGGNANNALLKLIKEKKLTRKAVKGGRGSTYALA